MKGFKLAAAAGIAAIGLGAAGVATANTVTFNLTGNVTTVCAVSTNAASTTAVDFGDLGTFLNNQWVQSNYYDIRYTCNATEFSRQISSTNGGVLSNGVDTIDYQMEHTNNAAVTDMGFGFTSVPNGSAATPWNVTFTPADFSTPNFSAEQVRFQARGAVDGTTGVPLPSGIPYEDTITVTITAM